MEIRAFAVQAEGSAKTLTRDWYCMDKDDPNMLKEKAPNKVEIDTFQPARSS